MPSHAPAFWHKPSWQGALLAPLSQLYWFVARRRVANVTPFKLSAFVICIGNNTVGGSGKTPTVLACAAILQEAGFKAAVISRGYQSTLGIDDVLRVDASRHTALDVGDEPLLIAQHLPCYVARKRLRAARAAIAEGAQVILMDDGMQNRALHKDLTIMVVDGGYGFGNGRMLPAGPCREPLRESLAKANAIVVMGEPSHPAAAALFHQHEKVFQAHLKPQEALCQSRLLAFSGIGRPAKFFTMLRAMGGELVAEKSFPDHHLFKENELLEMLQQSVQQKAQLMTTEKDWLRLNETWSEKVAFMPVKAQIERADDFAQMLLASIK